MYSYILLTQLKCLVIGRKKVIAIAEVHGHVVHNIRYHRLDHSADLSKKEILLLSSSTSILLGLC